MDDYYKQRPEELANLASKDDPNEFVQPIYIQQQKELATQTYNDRGRKMEFNKKSEPLTDYIRSAKALLKIPDVPADSITYSKNEEKKKELPELLTTLEEKLKLEEIELEGTDLNEKLQDAERKLRLLNKTYSDVAKVKLGGSKSRRRHSRHRKPVRKTRRGRGRKSKAKPKTHRRRRHSRARKHKKYTRKH